VRTPVFIAVAAFVALLVLGAVGVYAYDQGRQDEVAEGVTVGGIAVGGLDRERAARMLRRELLQPLSEPVVVRARGKSYRLGSEEARIAANVEAMVDDAIAAGREGSILERTVRNLTGEDVSEDVRPRVTYSREAVTRLVARVARNTDRPARDADVEFTANGLERVAGRAGLEVDRAQLRARVASALTRPGDAARTVRATIRRTRPKVSTKDLAEKYDTVLVVNRSGYKLQLFKRLKLEKAYPIAVGKAGLETPPGLYKIQNKAVNPAWHVPNSAWAGDLAGKVIPGGVPENPIKARWLGVYDGVGVHGTDARGSIGTNASHGCIRMLVEDVTELYDKVPVGAPIYIA
jgi:lipoprotein-anchoring transpeptidase ErfK/SrfK